MPILYVVKISHTYSKLPKLKSNHILDISTKCILCKETVQPAYTLTQFTTKAEAGYSYFRAATNEPIKAHAFLKSSIKDIN